MADSSISPGGRGGKNGPGAPAFYLNKKFKYLNYAKITWPGTARGDAARLSRPGLQPIRPFLVLVLLDQQQ